MMENKKKYEFDVETLQCGQARPYADSIYDYIVTSDEPERTVKEFCTKVLLPHSQPYDEWEPFSEDPSSYFYGYHTFEKIKDNKYRYRVVMPFTD